MSIDIGGEEKRIGMALSGGGFRAAAFHLGVFRKLAELNLLDKIDCFSCVSGGSIAGGNLAAHRKSPDVLDGMENYLKNKSIAVSSFFLGLLDPFHTRLDKLADTYDGHIFKGKTLGSLDGGPRFYFNSTNLASGNLFFFAGGAGRPPAMGDWELGICEEPYVRDYPLCRAVAASSAFPPVFPPLVLPQEIYKPASGVDYVALADGGVYDNLGINPLLASLNGIDYAIVSDAGKPFAIEQNPTEAGVVVVLESIGILMEQVRGLQFDRLEHRFAAQEGPKPVWFSIDSTDHGRLADDAAFASSISTDLKALSDGQLTVLTRHAGNLLEVRLARYMPELLA